MNLYAFSLNNPMRYVDPDGRKPFDYVKWLHQRAKESRVQEVVESLVETVVDGALSRLGIDGPCPLACELQKQADANSSAGSPADHVLEFDFRRRRSQKLKKKRKRNFKQRKRKAKRKRKKKTSSKEKRKKHKKTREEQEQEPPKERNRNDFDDKVDGQRREELDDAQAQDPENIESTDKTKQRDKYELNHPFEDDDERPD